MNTQAEKININGISYIPETAVLQPATKLDGLPYVIVRTYSAGVFAGYLQSRNGMEVVILKARRLWSWEGAASLSQLAVEGTKKPKECRFPCEVDKIEVTQAIEILDVTEKAKQSIAGVPVWKM